jgi:hypothetical protein
MIVYSLLAEYDLSVVLTQLPYVFLDAVVGDQRRDWTSGWETLDNSLYLL